MKLVIAILYWAALTVFYFMLAPFYALTKVIPLDIKIVETKKNNMISNYQIIKSRMLGKRERIGLINLVNFNQTIN